MDEITILIIEDDEDIRESVKILLENEGFHVIEADNGMMGCTRFQRIRILLFWTFIFYGKWSIKPVF